MNTQRLRKIRRSRNKQPVKTVKNSAGEDVKVFQSNADIDQYNNRQHMRCLETRRRKGSGDIGMQSATWAPIAHRPIASECERAAYRAKVLNHHDSILILYDAILDVVKDQSVDWNYRNNKERPPLEALATLVMQEFLLPSEFRVHGNPNAALSQRALAKSMKMDRQSYTDHWHDRFINLHCMVLEWHKRGVQYFDS